MPIDAMIHCRVFSASTALLASLLTAAILLVGCGRGDADKVAESDGGSVVAGSGKEADLAAATTGEQRLQAATEAQHSGALEAAWEMVGQALIASPNDANALRLAAEIQRDRGEFREGAALARRAAEADPSIAPAMMITAFGCHLRGQQYEDAERDLKRAAEISPNAAQVHRYLAQLLNAQGRRHEASRHVLELIRLRDVAPNELLSLIDRRGPFYLSNFDEIIDKDAVSLFSLGDLRFRYVGPRAPPDEQLDRIASIIEAFPDSTAAAAFRCRILADHDRFDQLQATLNELPPGIQEQPEYWYSIGVLLAHQDRHQEAIRGFAEAIRRDPSDRESLRLMIGSFNLMERTEEVVGLRERLGELDQIFRYARKADQEQAMWIAETLNAHVRPWESVAWLMHAERMSGNLQRVIPELDLRHAKIAEWERSASVDRRQHARLVRLLGFESDQWPLPDLKNLIVRDRRAVAQPQASGLRLFDIAESVGISTTFESGFPVDGSSFALYQVNGGGLAAIDYDLDGRCDIYIVQSGGSPLSAGSSRSNQLFRLMPENHFTEVTPLAGGDDRRFGQGVCAGDVNQDGFCDLIVANIGPNAVYINQGDGTFVEDIGRLTDNPFTWTSSVALADLSGDHLPEITEINYVDDLAAFSTRCQENYLDCQPQAFGEAQDRVLRGVADGTFEPWQSFADSSPIARLGFGVIVANFDRKQGNDFFITNDGDFNHFWLSVEASDGRPGMHQLVESAGVYGCSIGRGGGSQACMGVAAGDLNHDGMLDLHVTNFRNEPVNLFVQSESGTFTDLASRFGLAEPSFGVLGFGTQAADLDNDGWLDLAVLNGHVYDARFEGTPLRMLPQLFRGGAGAFALQDPSSSGPYWQRKSVGRTLATLDWNHDGRIDLLANHLDQPIALLQNDSDTQHWLQLELVGVTSEREAIGATVDVDAGGDHWTGWQIGGDGYMCTNEPVIHFGVGAAAAITQVEIMWPSGRSQVLSNLKPNRRYLVIEGVAEPHER